jgi:Ni/Fe-hydrogenase b-type cytochrome subunit
MDDGATTSGSQVPARVKRHRLSTRLWHWTNALAVFVMLMSGLMIFNAHPRLYWGQYGANFDQPWLSIGSTDTSGHLQIGPVQLPTTGVLGFWRDKEGNIQRRAFPDWATIPSYYSLASARRWHLAFAWLLALSFALYLVWSVFNRHLQHDLAPTRDQLKPRHIWHDIIDHARLRFPRGEAAARYNILQKLAYLGVIFLLLPVLILTGLTMGPGNNAAFPWLLDLFGGRQSARSLHFIAAMLILLFILVHLIMVVLAGPVNEIRSMITGWFRLPPERGEKA